MCLFLPVDTDEYKLWFDDVIKMLPWFSHSEQWNSSWLGILFRLSDDQPGKIDWSPYLDTIFTLMTRFLNLPVGRNRVDINVLSKFTNEDFGEIFLGDTDPVNDHFPFTLFLSFAHFYCENELLFTANSIIVPQNICSGQWAHCKFTRPRRKVPGKAHKIPEEH